MESIQLVGVPCPQCTKQNWINNGDGQDMTAVDVEAIHCWNCERDFWVDDGCRLMYEAGTRPADAMIEDGYETAVKALS